MSGSARQLNQLDDQFLPDRFGGPANGFDADILVVAIEDSIQLRATRVHPGRHLNLADAVHRHLPLQLSRHHAHDRLPGDALVQVFFTQEIVKVGTAMWIGHRRTSSNSSYAGPRGPNHVAVSFEFS